MQEEAIIFFLNKWYQITSRRFRRHDETTGYVGFNVSFHRF